MNWQIVAVRIKASWSRQFGSQFGWNSVEAPSRSASCAYSGEVHDVHHQNGEEEEVNDKEEQHDGISTDELERAGIEPEDEQLIHT